MKNNVYFWTWNIVLIIISVGMIIFSLSGRNYILGILFTAILIMTLLVIYKRLNNLN